MEINRNNINEVVNKSNAKPDKDYGQNFLVEPEVCKRIVSSLNVNKNDTVLEIGPGLGSLTHFLNLDSEKLTVVDIDLRMIAFLKIIYPNINIINSDIRKFDVSSFDKIIGNLPYNITTETIVYLLNNATSVKKIVLMIQSDAYPHFSDISGKEYGPTSVLLHLLGNNKKLFQVKAGSFYPAPKCGSTVFEINIDPICDRELAKEVFLFSKSMFLNRRKTIHNNLQNYLKNKDLSVELLNECQIPLTARPEDIDPSTYLKLYRCYKIRLSK